MAQESERAEDPLRALESVEHLPLSEQVAVFETAHDHLAALLSDAEA